MGGGTGKLERCPWIFFLVKTPHDFFFFQILTVKSPSTHDVNPSSESLLVDRDRGVDKTEDEIVQERLSGRDRDRLLSLGELGREDGRGGDAERQELTENQDG